MGFIEKLKKRLNQALLPKSVPELIIVVSGLPRSGTSLMMQMLVAGGIEPIIDGVRVDDEHNVNGYFELEAVKSMYKEPLAALTEGGGKAIKIVSPLLKFLPSDHQYKVIFLDRDIREIVRSQNAMLERNNPSAINHNVKNMEEKMASQVASTLKKIEASDHIQLLVLAHRSIITSPHENADKIQQFLGKSLDVDAMAKTVDPKLHRQRT